MPQERQLTTDEILREQYVRIPPQLQQLAVSPNIRQLTEAYASQRNLTLDEARAAENEVLFIVLGLEDRHDLADNLKAYTSIPDEEIGYLTEQITSELLSQYENAFLQLEERQHAAQQLSTTTQESPDNGGADSEDSVHDKNKDLTRDQILAEIENPQRSSPRASARPSDEHVPAGVDAEEHLKHNANQRGYEEGADPYREPVE